MAVEIKPKCGFLPTSRFISEENAIKKRVSRFKMHQILKLRRQEIPQLSEYDPLDLFSGSKHRVRKAIADLYRNPQNNFRVFLNGLLIHGGARNVAVGGDFETELGHVIQAEHGSRARAFIELVGEVLDRSQVLNHLLDAQKLDRYDIEGAIHAYYSAVSRPCVICGEEGGNPMHSIGMEESLGAVRDYLIAATAKDCSLMISFSCRKDGGGDLLRPYDTICLPSTNQLFSYKVNFIDLDLKPLEKMEYYYELDKKILESYNQSHLTRIGPEDIHPQS